LLLLLLPLLRWWPLLLLLLLLRLRLLLLLLCCVHEDEGVLQKLPDSRSDHGVPRQGCRQEADSVFGQVAGIHQLPVQDRLADKHTNQHTVGACRSHIRHAADVTFSRTIRSVWCRFMQCKVDSTAIGNELYLSTIPAPGRHGVLCQSAMRFDKELWQLRRLTCSTCATFSAAKGARPVSTSKHTTPALQTSTLQS